MILNLSRDHCKAFLPALIPFNINSAIFALFSIKILPCMPSSRSSCLWIFWLKFGSQFFSIFPPWLCFSFKNSFLIFVLICERNFLLSYFISILSLLLVDLLIQFYQTVFWKSLCHWFDCEYFPFIAIALIPSAVAK